MTGRYSTVYFVLGGLMVLAILFFLPTYLSLHQRHTSNVNYSHCEINDDEEAQKNRWEHQIIANTSWTLQYDWIYDMLRHHEMSFCIISHRKIKDEPVRWMGAICLIGTSAIVIHHELPLLKHDHKISLYYNMTIIIMIYSYVFWRLIFQPRGWARPWLEEVAMCSVRKFGCPCARDNQKNRRTTRNTDGRRTTINFHAPAVKFYLVTRIRTTKNLDGQPEIVTWLSVGQPFIFS